MVLLDISSFLLLHLIVAGQLINYTIDDTLGDELTGTKVQYSPDSRPENASVLVWSNALQCSGCAIAPERTSTMNGTWTGATYDSSLRNITARLSFHGSAIYIYLIVSNSPKSTGLVSDVLCDFRMDGEIVGSYNHTTDGTNHFDYDVLAYNNASLKDDDHTFLIETTGTQLSYVIFDYALYTSNQASTTGSTTSDSIRASSSSIYVSSSIPSSIGPSSSAVALSAKSVKALAAGIPVGIAALIIFAVSLVLCLRRRRRRVNLSTKQSFRSFIPLLRTIRQPDPVLRISLDDEDHFQESFTAQFVILRPRNKRSEEQESYQESTTLCSESSHTSPVRAVSER
ncbi:hypothetical protein EDD85DRAFT_437341, partial [Armillaria nabsnona]